MGCLEVTKRGLGICVQELCDEYFSAWTEEELFVLLDKYNFDFINRLDITDDPAFKQLSFKEKFHYTFLALGQNGIPKDLSVESIFKTNLQTCGMDEVLSKSFCLLHDLPVDGVQIGSDYNGDFFAFFAQFYPFPDKYTKTIQFSRTEFLGWLNEFFDEFLNHNYKLQDKLCVCEYYEKW